MPRIASCAKATRRSRLADTDQVDLQVLRGRRQRSLIRHLSRMNQFGNCIGESVKPLFQFWTVEREEYVQHMLRRRGIPLGQICLQFAEGLNN